MGVLTLKETTRLLEGHFSEMAILRKRNESAVCRVSVSGLETLIVKLWARPGFWGFVRRITRTSPMCNEWIILNCLSKRGVRTPRALDYGRVRIPGQPYTEMIMLEDLGDTINCVEHVKALKNSGGGKALADFEDELIEMTGMMLKAGVIDLDHSLMNTVVSKDGRPVLLDFEIARHVWFPAFQVKRIGQMLGRFMSSYIYAVQPDVERAKEFSVRLARALGVSRGSLRVAQAYVNRRLERQKFLKGISTVVELPW